MTIATDNPLPETPESVRDELLAEANAARDALFADVAAVQDLLTEASSEMAEASITEVRFRDSARHSSFAHDCDDLVQLFRSLLPPSRCQPLKAAAPAAPFADSPIQF